MSLVPSSLPLVCYFLLRHLEIVGVVSFVSSKGIPADAVRNIISVGKSKVLMRPSPEIKTSKRPTGAMSTPTTATGIENVVEGKLCQLINSNSHACAC